MNMNGEPNWFLIKNRVNLDPPPYVEDVTYSRKVRLIGSVATITNLNITVGGVADALFGPAGGAPRPFTRFMCNEIQAWTPASPDSFVRITAANPTVQGSSNADKAFSDIGTQGSVRPYVHARINNKDVSWLPLVTGETGALLFVVSVPPGRYVIDLMCHFSGTAGAPQILSYLPRELAYPDFTTESSSQNCPMDTTPPYEPLISSTSSC